MLVSEPAERGLLLFPQLDRTLDLQGVISQVIARIYVIISRLLSHFVLQQETDKPGSWNILHSPDKTQHNASKAAWSPPGTCARHQRHFLAWYHLSQCFSSFEMKASRKSCPCVT